MAADAASVIAAETDNWADCGLPAPNAFETLVLSNPPKRETNQKERENSFTIISFYMNMNMHKLMSLGLV